MTFRGDGAGNVGNGENGGTFSAQSLDSFMHFVLILPVSLSIYPCLTSSSGVLHTIFLYSVTHTHTLRATQECVC